jgi:pentatricopeptide repeat protein
VMVKAGKFDLAWKILKKMDGEGYQPNSLTYKGKVNCEIYKDISQEYLVKKAYTPFSFSRYFPV